MMRRRIILLALLASLVGSPSAANQEPGWRPVTFKYRIPCSVACAYWADAANLDVDDDPYPEVYFNACRAPFPPLSYDDLVVAAPFGADLLQFDIFPWFDWDGFMCGPNGEELAIGSNLIGELCDNVLGTNSPIPFGCAERHKIKVRSGQVVILRVFNWSDPFPVTGRYRFVDLG